jgi:hypothetical protein
MRKPAIALLLLLIVSACTTMNVKRIDAKAHPISLICIEENPEVLVSDFLSVLESNIQQHGIRTLVYKGSTPERCEYTVAYTASRGWDFKPFMNYAEIRLRRAGETISIATYKHGGGFALNKWASTESKLNPVLDELFANFQTK